MEEIKPTRKYFQAKQRAINKKLKAKVYKPVPAPPFRPITGQRAVALRIRVRRIKRKKRIKPFRRRADPREVILFHVRAYEKQLWMNVAYDLGMPLGALVRMAIRNFMTNSRHLRSLIDGDEETIVVKRVRRSSLERKLNKAFGYREEYHGSKKKVDLPKRGNPNWVKKGPADLGSGTPGRADTDALRRSAPPGRDHAAVPSPGARSGVVGPGRDPAAYPAKPRLMIGPT